MNLWEPRPAKFKTVVWNLASCLVRMGPEQQGVNDRCERRLFSSASLKPASTTYVSISQKQMSATAARYVILWLSNLCKTLLADQDFPKTQEFLFLG